MPSLSTRTSGLPDVGDLLVLVDELADSRVELSATRGAIVTSFQVKGRELIYLDAATLADTSKNVRGGIPVLFPSPGRLVDDSFQRDGQHGAMKQHGFARNLAFTPSATSDSKAQVTLTLRSNAETRAQFPWDFVLQLHFSLEGSRLTIGLRVENPGSVPLPFAFGLHPYFAIADKAQADIDTEATQVFDNVTKTVLPFHGFDLTLPEVDLHLLDHGSTNSALHFADGTHLELRATPEFQRWVVWTLSGKDFVCVEPWTAPFDALNSGAGLLYVPAGGVHEGSVDMELMG